MRLSSWFSLRNSQKQDALKRRICAASVIFAEQILSNSRLRFEGQKMGNQAFKPPLTKAELEELQERYPYSKDVRRLLWEIKRLHSIVLRADQLQRSLPDSMPEGQSIALLALRNELKDEPCVKEERQWREDLLKS